ncbi:hypothetical protein UFOVP149_18 [uncultured Caudovirales phage]|uniref:Uncharacterized protein n=1 Tax=uncultured Caudovirales phage TaxID=2100421 RepID=A0A6J7W9Y6_9CAUD|nr:hypothetical protein UFOVP149_18 [uncultured Caudovirales phage]
MADAKPTKIGLDSAVAMEVAAKAPADAAAEAPAAIVDERRVVGVAEFAAPNGSKIVVTNL